MVHQPNRRRLFLRERRAIQMAAVPSEDGGTG